jgi:pimeloyl-ACP methyl ester carboxylesterase
VLRAEAVVGSGIRETARPRISRRAFLGVAASAAVAGTAAPALGRLPRTKAPRHFVLVHGAWHGAWCWYKIVAGLEDAGHRVTAIDLPSAGIDPTPAGSVTLQAQADRIVATLDTVAEPVILVGHSAGGPPISLAAEARPDGIQKLVYLTAFLLPDATSIATVALQDKGTLIPAHLTFNPDGTFEVERSARQEIFYNECDERDIALAQTLLRPASLRSNTDAVAVGDRFARVRRFYVSCLHDHAISPDTQRAMYTALPCERVFSIRSDHSAFLSHPTMLLRILATIARA